MRDPLQLISSAIGSAEINEKIAEAQPKNSVDLLRSIERSLIEMGALRVLVEERMVWAYNDSVMPFLGPTARSPISEPGCANDAPPSRADWRVCLFTAAVLGCLCWMGWLSGSLEELRFQRDAGAKPRNR